MLRGEDGQAVVEAAIVLPAMVFLLLLALQLTQLQQARILAEYAASAAARAGSVMDGDPARMKQAATLAALSASGPFDGGSAIATSHILAAGIAVPDGTPEGIPIAALAAAARAGRYYLPGQAFYTMRMQSNPYRKWAHP